MKTWTGPIIRYATLWGMAISAGLAFGPIAALVGFTLIAILAFTA